MSVPTAGDLGTVPGPGAHAGGADTEHQAAASLGTLWVQRAQADVYTLLRDAGAAGLTDGEGSALLGSDNRLTFGRRRHELAQAGLVRDSGMRRAGPSGRAAIVWIGQWPT